MHNTFIFILLFILYLQYFLLLFINFSIISYLNFGNHITISRNIFLLLITHIRISSLYYTVLVIFSNQYVVVPNITEACFLSGHANQGTYSKYEIEEITKRLHKLGANALIITSASIDGKMFTVVKKSADEPSIFLPYEEIPVRFPGTGNIFISMTVGHYLKSGNLLKSVETAMRQIERIIRANRNNTDKYKGIPIEQFGEEITDEKTEDYTYFN